MRFEIQRFVPMALVLGLSACGQSDPASGPDAASPDLGSAADIRWFDAALRGDATVSIDASIPIDSSASIDASIPIDSSASIDTSIPLDASKAVDGTVGGDAAAPVCGDGVLAAGEACDDGNTRPRDGCDIYCKVQVGYTCSATSPSVCAPIPRANPASVLQVSGGSRHLLVRKLDGSVWDWGVNSHGQLGDNTIVERDTPVQVHGPGNVGFVAPITDMVGGEVANYALSPNQTVWSWGWNPVDELGDGVAGGESHVPVQVLVSTNPPVPLSSITSLGGRGDHGLSVDSKGTVWTWGSNFKGQLGNNTKVDSPVAVHVLAGAGPGTGPGGMGGFLSQIVSITGGGAHSIALDSSGHLWGWGFNFHGQLGNGTFDRVPNIGIWSPVEAMADPQTPFANVVQVSAGWNHTVALRSDGTVWTFGIDSEGELGNGNNTTNSAFPYQVTVNGNTPLTNVVSVSGGDFHTAVLKSDGTVWTWGQNLLGQLGNGTFDNNNARNFLPNQVLGPNGVGYLTNVILLAAREAANIAVQADGTVVTWGFGANGTLGTGNLNNSAFPVQVSGLGPTP